MNAEQRARAWLARQGCDDVALSHLAGYTNDVFLVILNGQNNHWPQRSILRLANPALTADLCPLAHCAERIIKLHQDVAALGLAPSLIAAESEAGIMWLEYAGDSSAIKTKDFVSVRQLLDNLHRSNLRWPAVASDNFDSDCESDTAWLGLTHLQAILAQKAGLPPRIQAHADQLLQPGLQRGYADYPQVAVHNDLNPGNWLYDQQRWWLIDWDFAGMGIAAWDYAGLIVEHEETVEWGLALTSGTFGKLKKADLIWFCSSFALLSECWHIKRGSKASLLLEKQRQTNYWMSLFTSNN